jgi:ubiquinone biosynthesis accessory factor UbiJ
MITERIQSLLDRNVAGSPRARQLLTRLAGKRMAVVARFTPWRVTIAASPDRLVLSRENVAADATLSGTPMALMSLAHEAPEEVIRRGDVKMEGNGDVAAAFQELLQLLRPDLEAELARVIGDVPAYGAGQLLRKALQFGRSSANTAALNVGEYFTHEKRELVPQAEAADFLHGVDELRESADRLAARVALLEKGTA